MYIHVCIFRSLGSLVQPGNWVDSCTRAGATVCKVRRDLRYSLLVCSFSPSPRAGSYPFPASPPPIILFDISWRCRYMYTYMGIYKELFFQTRTLKMLCCNRVHMHFISDRFSGQRHEQCMFGSRVLSWYANRETGSVS